MDRQMKGRSLRVTSGQQTGTLTHVFTYDEPNPHNIRYLETKRDKMGHTTLLNGDRNAQSA